MDDCQFCATESVIYRRDCRRCLIRRIARLPRPTVRGVIAQERKVAGQGAAEQMKGEVAAEHKRLVEIGQL